MSAAKAHPVTRRHREGMTLIELLLATAIGLLLIGVVYSVYHTAMMVLSGQAMREKGRTAAVRAVDEVAAHLAQSLGPEGEDRCAFVLSRDDDSGGNSSELSFCCAVSPGADDDPQWFEIRHVVFRTDEVEPGRLALVCEHQPIVGPGSQLPPQTNVLIEGIERFSVLAFTGEEWVDEWPQEESDPWPTAARVVLAIGDSDRSTFSAETFIPIANAVSSRLERSGQVLPSSR